jgi:hypothetical protein
VQNFTQFIMHIRKLGQHFPARLKRPLIKVWLLVERLDVTWQSRHAQINPKPIFVLGNQKAGTSAITALLAEMTASSASIDLINENLYKHQSYPRLRMGEVSFSKFLQINRLSFSRDIVKEANLTIFYDELVKHFPQSKFVFILRDPRDNIKSQLHIMGVPGHLPHLHAKHLKNLRNRWNTIIDGSWIGLTGGNYVEMLAARWNFMTDMYLNHLDNMVLVRYEDFVKDKVGEITRLARILGLTQVNDITAKVDIQFQPKGNRDIGWTAFFGQDNLARIEHICGDRMKRFHYPLHKNAEATVISKIRTPLLKVLPTE